MRNALQTISVPEYALPATQGGTGDGTDRINFRSIWSIFRRRLGVFIAIVALSLLAGLVFTLRQTPLYTAAAQVSLNPQVDQIAPTSTADAQAERGAPSSTYADTQVQIIASEALALRVADALKLGSQAEFRQIPEQPARWFGLTPGRPGATLTIDEARQRAALYLQGSVKAQRIGETYSLIIAFSNPNPERAALIANEYARQYTQADMVDQRSLHAQSRRFLSGRLDQLRGQAQADTEAVQRYRIANNLPTTTGSNLTEQEISSYNQAVATARAQTAEDQARLDTARAQMRQGSSGDDVGEALQSPVVSGLRQRQAQLVSELANLRARYGDLHPEVIKSQSELTALDGQIQGEIKRILSNLDAKRRVSAQREGSLESSLGRASGALSQNNRAMAGLDDLQRRASASQSLYESYLNRYKELMAREGTEQPTSRILSSALTPSAPVSPKPLLNMILSLAIGFGLGVAAALATELLFSGLTTGDDVEDRLRVPYIGSIPTLSSVVDTKSTPLATIVKDPKSSFAEAFRSLRATLYSDEHMPQVIAIASSLPKEGKTTAAICLARSYYLAGQSTVLVDCDLRRQGVSRYLRNQPSRPGLLELLRGEATLSETLIVEDTGLHVLPISGNGNTESELITGEEFDKLLDNLRNRFNKVILDTAPLLPIADARMVVAKADAAVLLVRWRETPDSAVRAALRLLSSTGAKLTGVVLSQVNMKKQVKFGYGDGEFYYRSYKSYYA